MSVYYDVRNPPTNPVIATFTYSGPPIEICGNPVISVVDSEGVNISFLVVTFNSVTGIFSVSIQDVNTAVKGNYTLNAVFT